MAFDPSSLAACLRAKFFCSGMYEADLNDFTLFYGKDENTRYDKTSSLSTLTRLSHLTAHRSSFSRRVDLFLATEAQLESLFQGCDAVEGPDASFGTLQPNHFSSNFNLERSGLLQTLRPLLLDGYLENQGIEAELYELNVYGER
jgi:hypothetical protein